MKKKNEVQIFFNFFLISQTGKSVGIGVSRAYALSHAHVCTRILTYSHGC
jgi:hypothetical protein